MATDPGQLDLVLLWHMHQPDYRDAASGRYLLPWVYLHALKDYSDMAAHAERHAGIRCTFNFVPVLLEQLEDYVTQFDVGRIRDPLLRLLQVADLDRIDPQDRALILDSCFRTNHESMLQPYAHYRRLHDLFRKVDEGDRHGFEYLSGAYLADLLTWYHLVWVGETERRSDPLFGRLMAKGAGFGHGDRLQLFDAIGVILRRLLGRYRALASDGRIEVSTTPYTHPLAPLMIDFQSARESLPDAPLPASPAYPGGAERVRWHLDEAITGHLRRFGIPPAGLWPAEGAVSAPLLEEVAKAGIRWSASSESVLANSLGEPGWDQATRRSALYRPWTLEQAPGVQMLFRDERLSDLIGFEYSKWHGRDAAAHFIAELESIAREAPVGEPPLVLVALDGENAWEYFPFNGFYFFEELYSALEAHPFIRTRTVSEALARPGRTAGALPRLVAGSWVMGTMSTWIGERDKNRAWDLLVEAKLAWDEAMAADEFTPERRFEAERQLAACESSDWFWWLGSYNPAHAVDRFERLFRHNLRRLYELIGRRAPASLDVPLSLGSGRPEAGGAMRRATPAD
ncbi:MAG TPA: glycoside hydrolase family 57 protein [Quisquiliibacterium sp.]|nr:glycoside hydrolase family 57 protein [Quisquiliibacterium sp.]